MNQLVSQQAGGALVFKGTVSEPATMTVGGKPATVTADNRFEGQAVVPSGTGQVAVTATDPSGNVRTSTYQVSQGATSKAFTYDLNGNMTSDGTRTYEWDAENRLVAVTEGTRRSEFAYDGVGARVGIVEKSGALTTRASRFIWCLMKTGEERDGTGATMTTRLFADGAQEGGLAVFYAKDHLGSPRELTSEDGATLTRYDYGPYGRGEKLSGTVESDWTFTGHYAHRPMRLALTRFRIYEASLGRWLSEDPAGRIDGANLYRYVLNNPVGNRDRSGLITTKGCDPLQQKELASAAQRAEERISKGCCLPKSENAQAWVQKIRTATYHCGGTSPYCAWAGDPQGTITGKDATYFNDAFALWNLAWVSPGCGCLEATVLHETSHFMGAKDRSEPNAYAIERGCFTCGGIGSK